MVSEQERTGRYAYLPEEGRYGRISASLHDRVPASSKPAAAMQQPQTQQQDNAVEEYEEYTAPMADAPPNSKLCHGRRRRSSRRDSLDSFASTGSGTYESTTRSETEMQSMGSGAHNTSKGNDAAAASDGRKSLVGRSISVADDECGNASNTGMLSSMNRRGSQASSVHSAQNAHRSGSGSRRASVASSVHSGGSAAINLAPAAQNDESRRGSMMSSVASLNNANASTSMHASRRGSVLSAASATHNSRRGSMASAASANSGSYHRGRNNRAVDANLARSIKTDATRVTVDDELWRQFKSRCSTTGSITNVAAKELLREQVMEAKCYHTHKQELVEAEREQEEQEQRRWSRRASAALSRQEQAVRDQANQVSTGLRRAFSSALSLVSMEALALHDEAVDVTEQQAIMNSLSNSGISNLHASGSCARVGEFGITGSVLEVAVRDASTEAAFGTERTAAQVLADSLSNSFGSMKRTLSGDLLASLGTEAGEATDEAESTQKKDGEDGSQHNAEWGIGAASSTRSLSNRPKRGKRPSILSSVGSIAGASSVESFGTSSYATGSTGRRSSYNSGVSAAGSDQSGDVARRSSYVTPSDIRRKSGGRMSTLLLNFDDMEEELSDYRSDTSDEDEQSLTQEDIAAGPKSTGEDSVSDLEASISLQASQYLATKLQSGDVQEAIGRHQALFRRLSEQHAMMASAAALQRRRSSRRLSLTSSEEGDGSINLDDVQHNEDGDEDDSGNELGKSFSTIKSYRSRAA